MSEKQSMEEDSLEEKKKRTLEKLEILLNNTSPGPFAATNTLWFGTTPVHYKVTELMEESEAKSRVSLDQTSVVNNKITPTWTVYVNSKILKKAIDQGVDLKPSDVFTLDRYR